MTLVYIYTCTVYSVHTCTQVNLEYLGRVVFHMEDLLYPDSLVGTDSHTTMINGLGIVGWGQHTYNVQCTYMYMYVIWPFGQIFKKLSYETTFWTIYCTCTCIYHMNTHTVCVLTVTDCLNERFCIPYLVFGTYMYMYMYMQGCRFGAMMPTSASSSFSRRKVWCFRRQLGNAQL